MDLDHPPILRQHSLASPALSDPVSQRFSANNTPPPSAPPALSSFPSNSYFEESLLPRPFAQRSFVPPPDPRPTNIHPRHIGLHHPTHSYSETWMDFLRQTQAQGNEASDSASASASASASVGPGPLSPSANAHTYGRDTAAFASNSSSSGVGGRRSDIGTQIQGQDRKRRLTAPESPLRRGANGGRYTAGSTASAPIDLTGSPSAGNAITLQMASPPHYTSSAPGVPGGMLPPPLHRRRSSQQQPQSQHQQSPPQQHLQAQTQGQTQELATALQRRRDSEIVLPPWQPDSEVLACPVCRKEFGFFNRRHHCRKCGRVVCAVCSPHRITIPRQYIVQPPTAIPAEIIDLTGDMQGAENDSGPNAALGGGEEVRVCNPCVPDPNLSPPPLQGMPSQSFGGSPLPPPAYTQFGGFLNSNQHQHQGQEPTAFSAHQPLTPNNRHFRASYAGPSSSSTSSPQPNPDLFRDPRITFSNRTSVGDLWPPPLPPQPQMPLQMGAPAYNTPPSIPPFYQPPFQDPAYAHAQQGPLNAPGRLPAHARPHRSSSASQGSFAQRYRNLDAPLPPSPVAPNPPHQPPRRREIAEEDECPVCGEELPPKDPDGGEKEREQHVEECIRENMAGFGGGSSVSATSQPQLTATNAAQQRGAGANRNENDEALATASAPAHSSTPFPAAHFPSGRGSPASSFAGARPQQHQQQHQHSLQQHQQQQQHQQHQQQTPQIPNTSSGTPPSGSRPRRATTGPRARMLVYRATEKDALDEDGGVAECVICFEEFGAGCEMGRLECLCRFHRACIRQWWNTKGVGMCPTHQLHT